MMQVGERVRGTGPGTAPGPAGAMRGASRATGETAPRLAAGAARSAGRIVLAVVLATALTGAVRAEERFVRSGAATIHVTIEGTGPTVVFLPSLGRGAEDFDDLAARLARGGYRTVRPDPRQIGKSTGPLTGLSLHDMAADVAAVIREAGGAPVILLGHAFGSRLARMTSADHPSLVRQLVLLGAGGARGGTSQAVLDGITRCFDTTLARDEHLAAVARMFFAPGHDPSPWEHGWHRPVMEAQRAATAATRRDAWWAGGTAPILLLQPEQDAVSEPEVGHALRDEFPGRVTLVTIPNAGHSLMPEQPDLVAKAILDYLTARLPRP